MRYQHKWQDVPLDDVPPDNQRNLQATIHQALELGINHVETARGYGSSERQLGLVLPKIARQRLIVQTKIAPEDDPASFTANFEDSLTRLRLDYVDLLALHGINNDAVAEQALRPGGCLAAARRIQQRGLARHIGFSTHATTDQIVRYIRHEADGGFDYVNLHWYWIFQANRRAIEAATARDMGVFIISPSDKGGRLYDPPAKLTQLTQPLHPITFNDLFCLAHPQVHTLSVGAARPTDFDLHVAALPRLDRADEVLPSILRRLQDAMDEAVAPDLHDPFQLPLPTWDHTPGQVNLPVILWLLSLAKAYDMIGYGRMRYNLLGNGGHWFPGLNAAALDEAALQPIARACGLDGRLTPLLREAHELLAGEENKRLSQS